MENVLKRKLEELTRDQKTDTDANDPRGVLAAKVRASEASVLKQALQYLEIKKT